MKSRSWAMLFAGLIAALLLLWKLLPGSGGNTVGVRGYHQIFTTNFYQSVNLVFPAN